VGRGPLTWIGIVVGIVVVLGVTALIGNEDDSGEPVPAGVWAQNVCGAVGVWRGELEATIEEIRTPSAVSVSVACIIVDQSERDPMMTPTNGFIGALYSS